MAVKFSAPSMVRTSEYRCLPEDIRINLELNGRHNAPDVQSLIQDILTNGQLQPVTIRKDGETPVLVAGFSRWRAISEINERGLTPVKMQVRCSYTQCTEQGGFLMNISENRQRNEVTPIDDAHNVARLRRFGMTDDQIAKVYFPNSPEADMAKNARWINDRAELLSLTPEAQEALTVGRLKVTAAVELSRLSQSQQEAAVACEGPILVSDVRELKAAAAQMEAQCGPIAGKERKQPKEKKKKLPAVVALDNILNEIDRVVDTGKFELNGKERIASDQFVEWLALLAGKTGRRDV